MKLILTALLFLSFTSFCQKSVQDSILKIERFNDSIRNTYFETLKTKLDNNAKMIALKARQQYTLYFLKPKHNTK